MSINTLTANQPAITIELNLYQALTNALTTLSQKYQRAHSRKALLNLDQDQLNDIGISAEAAYAEGSKYFWEN